MRAPSSNSKMLIVSASTPEFLVAYLSRNNAPKALTNQNNVCDFLSPKLSFMLFCAMHTVTQSSPSFIADHFVPPSRKFPFMKLQLVSFTAFLAFATGRSLFQKAPCVVATPRRSIFYMKSYAKTAPMWHLATRKEINQFVISSFLYGKYIGYAK